MAETNGTSDRPDRDSFGPLADSLGFLLRLSQLRSFETFFAEMADLDVRPGEMSMILLLAENPGIRQGVLASRLRIKRAHMAKMVRVLEDAGLIEREVPRDDRRAMELRLTEAGRARAVELAPRLAALEARVPPGLTAAETDMLKDLLRKFLSPAAEEVDE